MLRKEFTPRVFQNWLLRRIFGPKTEDITNGLRKLLIGELRNFYFNSDFTRTIKMRIMSWAEDLAEIPEE
jgi:hypothetical protein